MREFVTAVEEIEKTDEGTPVEEQYVEFKLDGRVMRAYQPTDGQLVFMLASMGRGQSNDQRFASVINIILASLRDEDADYLTSRLLTRDHKDILPVAQIEQIFEYLTEEWFARPTQSQSDSAESSQSDGQN